MTNKVAMIGLDACDIKLVYRWAEEGKLPTFKSLIDKSATMQLSSSCSVLQGSIWPSFFTAANPAEHGMYYMLQMDNKTQNVKRVKANDLKKPPFWSVLNPQKKCLVVDVPKLGLSETGNNVQVVEWAAMDHYSSFQTYPASIKGEIINDFGNHVLTHDLEEPKNKAEYQQLLQKLLDGIDNKTQLNIKLFEQQQPDLFVSIFGESHPAGHYLWQFHQEFEENGTSEYFTEDPLLTVYQQLDRCLATMLQHFDESQDVFIFSGHGMMEDLYPRWILNEVLSRLGVLVEKSKPTSHQHQMTSSTEKKSSSLFSSQKILKSIKNFANEYILPKSLQTRLWMKNLQKHVDFERSKAWVLPTDLQGFIRLNVQGREPQGIVPQEQYDEVIDEITQCLLSLKDADTGKPVVDQVFKLKELYQGGEHADLLPDISVLWHNIAVKKIESNSIGEIVVGNSGIIRSGNHRPKGFCFCYGPSINVKAKDIEENLTTLGSFAMNILGNDDYPLPESSATLLTPKAAN
jgi:predicted AlkP superfamily phosphohydrolase/phosphomutase